MIGDVNSDVDASSDVVADKNSDSGLDWIGDGITELQDKRAKVRKKKAEIKLASEFGRTLTLKMESERGKIRSMTKRLHHASITLLSSFSTVCLPKFRVDLKKKACGGLAKGWKSPMNYLGFGSHHMKLKWRMQKLGKTLTEPSEACSTMAHCVCGTLHSPGTHWLHHCPNPKCRKVTFRDECGRMIGILSDIRILQRRAEQARGSNGLTHSRSLS